ncbi:MAG: transglutaminase domain-containing protein [Lachnospiraceae bacterium]|nr:transglutaminase domain-containing protein [Lachnospiraceae bacterium]
MSDLRKNDFGDAEDIITPTTPEKENIEHPEMIYFEDAAEKAALGDEEGDYPVEAFAGDEANDFDFVEKEPNDFAGEEANGFAGEEANDFAGELYNDDESKFFTGEIIYSEEELRESEEPGKFEDYGENEETGEFEEYEDTGKTIGPAREKKQRKRRFPFGIPIAVALVILLGLGGYYLYTDYKARVYRRCQMEATTQPVVAEDFAKDPVKYPVIFADEAQAAAIDTVRPGDYEVTVKSWIYKYDCVITIVDTIAPTADPVPVNIEYGQSAGPEEFIENLIDVTQVTAEFEEQPDFSKTGKRNVSIILTDLGGNQTKVESVLTVIPVKKEVTAEAGTAPVSIDDFLFNESDAQTIKMNTAVTEDMMKKVGEHRISFTGGGEDYESVLMIVDTVAPVIETQSLEKYTTEDITIGDFVVSCEDVTEVKYYFEVEPDFEHEGTVPVVICAEDEGGNVTKANAEIKLKYDTEAPVISGTHDINTIINMAIDYRGGITVTDNCDETVELSITSAGVNVKAAGQYPVTYTATDRAGNSTSVTITVTVIEPSYDDATISGLAGQIVSQIITPDMSGYDKLSAIFYWVRRNIRYSESDEKENWRKAAYWGMVFHTGDCYTYCMTSRALLDAAGITNMVIDTVPLRYIHYWNLVDIGEGWRHFDTTPRLGGGDFLYWTDAQITEYSNSHANSHIYDRERFPGIQ